MTVSDACPDDVRTTSLCRPQSHVIVEPSQPASFTAWFSRVSRTSLAGAWALNEGTVTAVIDSSGNGRTGTISGSATWTTGRHGQALSFNGSSTVVSLGDLDLPGPFTVMGWLQTRSLYAGTCESALMKAFGYGIDICSGQLSQRAHG